MGNGKSGGYIAVKIRVNQRSLIQKTGAVVTWLGLDEGREAFVAAAHPPGAPVIEGAAAPPDVRRGYVA
jgi:hypothetical protein